MTINPNGDLLRQWEIEQRIADAESLRYVSEEEKQTIEAAIADIRSWHERHPEAAALFREQLGIGDLAIFDPLDTRLGLFSSVQVGRRRKETDQAWQKAEAKKAREARKASKLAAQEADAKNQPSLPGMPKPKRPKKTPPATQPKTTRVSYLTVVK